MVEMTKKWTWEELKELRNLASKGFSALAISRILIGRTRNSVIGVCHRNGIQLQNKNGSMVAAERALLPSVPKRVRPSRSKPRPIGPNFDPLPKAYIVRKTTIVDDENFVPMNIKITDLRHSHCRSVVGEIDAGDTMYCGHEVVPGKSWCPHHMMKYTYPLIKRVA